MFVAVGRPAFGVLRHPSITAGTFTGSRLQQ